jgi:hypothetical protein
MSLGLFFGTFVGQLPILAVLVVGLILLSQQGARLPGRSRQLGRAGLVVLLAESVAAMVWSVLLPQIIYQVGSGRVRTYALLNAGVGLVLALLSAAGVGLLVAAVLAARQPSYPPSYAPPPGSVPPDH